MVCPCCRSMPIQRKPGWPTGTAFPPRRQAQVKYGHRQSDWRPQQRLRSGASGPLGVWRERRRQHGQRRGNLLAADLLICRKPRPGEVAAAPPKELDFLFCSSLVVMRGAFEASERCLCAFKRHRPSMANLIEVRAIRRNWRLALVNIFVYTCSQAVRKGSIPLRTLTHCLACPSWGKCINDAILRIQKGSYQCPANKHDF